MKKHTIVGVIAFLSIATIAAFGSLARAEPEDTQRLLYVQAANENRVIGELFSRAGNSEAAFYFYGRSSVYEQLSHP